MTLAIKTIAFACAMFAAGQGLAANAITYTYDDLNRLTTATRSDGPTFTYNYDEVGNITVHTSTNPDSDGDGLTDIAEINVHGSNPALGDTDLDGLSDGDEVNIGTDPTNPDTDGDGISDGNEVAAGTDPLVPGSQGAGEAPTITTTTTPVLQSGNLGIAWSGIATPTPFDWFGVYQVGAGNIGYVYWAYTDGTERGETTFALDNVSLVPGMNYEIRLLENDGNTRLATSAPFVLNPTGPTVIAASTPVTLGGKLGIAWAGIASPTPTDWVGIYEPGAPNSAYLDWTYTDAGSAGNLSLLLAHPGLVAGKIYEVRLFAQDTYMLLGTSGSFVLQEASIDDKYSYTIANPGLAGAEAWVVSLSDNNTVTAGSILLRLNRYERGQIPAGVLTQGMVVSGEGPFDMGSSVDATDMPLSNRLAGTRFVMPQIRYTHWYYLVSPEGDATVQVDVNGVVTPLSLPQGQIVEFNAGYDATGTTLINSDLPILVTHRGDTGSVFADASPVPPAALELWGVRTSASAYVGALKDNTTLSIYADDGSSVTDVVLNAGQRYTINTVGVSGAQGSGSGLRIVSDKPVGAIQIADGDGGDQTAYMPTSQLGIRFGLPTAAQYLAVVCPRPDTTVTLYDGMSLPQPQVCGGDGVNPGKAYFGSAANGVNIGAGAYLESDQPVYAIYEDAATDDEHNLNPEVMEITVVTTTTTPVLQSGNLGIAWSGIATPTPLDWFGVYQVGSGNLAYAYWAYTDGSERGELTIALDSVSLVPGMNYEIRLFENDGNTRLATSAPFVLNPTGPTVIVASTPVTLGGKLDIAWAGIANPTSTDWVGIYEPGTPNGAYLDWTYTDAGIVGNLGLLLAHPDLVAGNLYEVRLFAQDGNMLLGTSGSFVLQEGSIQ